VIKIASATEGLYIAVEGKVYVFALLKKNM